MATCRTEDISVKENLPLFQIHSPYEDFCRGHHTASSRHDLDLYVPPFSIVWAPDVKALSSVRGPREMTAQLHVVNVVSDSNIKIMYLVA